MRTSRVITLVATKNAMQTIPFLGSLCLFSLFLGSGFSKAQDRVSWHHQATDDASGNGEPGVILHFDPLSLIPGQAVTVTISIQDTSGKGFGIGAVVFEFANPDGGLMWDLDGSDDTQFTADDGFVWLQGLDGLDNDYFATVDPPQNVWVGGNQDGAVQVGPNATLAIATIDITADSGDQATFVAGNPVQGIIFDVATLLAIPTLKGSEQVTFTIDNCCTPHDTAGCTDTTVEECVCSSHPNCCAIAWSCECVELAGTMCTDCPGDDCNDNGIPDDCETDDDGDGVIDVCDECPDTPLGWPVGDDGCSDSFGACCFPDEICVQTDQCDFLGGSFLGPGLSCDGDADGDGAFGCDDGCPFDSDKVTPGICGCGVPDADTDGDGFVDCVDSCPATEDGVPVNECGCAALGACCFKDKNKKVCAFDETQASVCTTLGGAYQGDGALCDDGCVFGDFDDDGDVDLIDFGVLQSCFTGSSGGQIEPGCERGDIDGCGVIDLFDFAAFQAVLNGS